MPATIGIVAARNPGQRSEPSSTSIPFITSARRSRDFWQAGQTRMSRSAVFIAASARSARTGRRAGARGSGSDVERRPSAQHRLHRVGEDPKIEPERAVLDVVQVVPHLLDLLLEVVRVPVADLGPAGDAGPGQRANGVVRDLFAALGRVAQHGHEQREVRKGMRSGPDQVHVAAEHVDELGQLVQPESPEPEPDAA